MNLFPALAPYTSALKIGALVLIFAAGGATAWKVQGWRLDAVKAEYNGFKAQVDAEGRVAQIKADIQAKKDKQTQEAANAENIKSRATRVAATQRVRDARPSGGILPPAPAAAVRPDLACFDRALLGGALRSLDQGLQGVVDACDQTAVDLNTARRWGRGLRMDDTMK